MIYIYIYIYIGVYMGCIGAYRGYIGIMERSWKLLFREFP